MDIVWNASVVWTMFRSINSTGGLDGAVQGAQTHELCVQCVVVSSSIGARTADGGTGKYTPESCIKVSPVSVNKKLKEIIVKEREVFLC